MNLVRGVLVHTVCRQYSKEGLRGGFYGSVWAPVLYFRRTISVRRLARFSLSTCSLYLLLLTEGRE